MRARAHAHTHTHTHTHSHTHTRIYLWGISGHSGERHRFDFTVSFNVLKAEGCKPLLENTRWSIRWKHRYIKVRKVRATACNILLSTVAVVVVVFPVRTLWITRYVQSVHWRLHFLVSEDCVCDRFLFFCFVFLNYYYSYTWAAACRLRWTCHHFWRVDTVMQGV